MDEILAWLLSREFRVYLLDHDLVFPLLFAARVIGVTTLEQIYPARQIPYRSLLFLDILGATLVGYFLVPAARYLSHFLAVSPVLPDAILTLPTVVAFLLYYLVGDFGAYWMHRFLHLSPVWRAHKWHHSPTSMYWLAGYRASLPQQVLFNLPWMFAYAVLGLAPWWMYLLVTASHMLLNDWMHMNVSWRSNWLERVLVTPRYHHIHHSENLAYANSNFGVTLSIWDRIFGTYRDPDMITEPLSFGIGEPVPTIRLIAGI